MPSFTSKKYPVYKNMLNMFLLAMTRALCFLAKLEYNLPIVNKKILSVLTILPGALLLWNTSMMKALVFGNGLLAAKPQQFSKL